MSVATIVLSVAAGSTAEPASAFNRGTSYTAGRGIGTADCQRRTANTEASIDIAKHAGTMRLIFSPPTVHR